MLQPAIAGMIEPCLGPGLRCFGCNFGVGVNNLLDALKGLSCPGRCTNATVEGIEDSDMAAGLCIQARSFQYGRVTLLDESYRFKVGACILLMVATLTQHQYSDDLAL